jgi:hypothetical protein
VSITCPTCKRVCRSERGFAQHLRANKNCLRARLLVGLTARGFAVLTGDADDMMWVTALRANEVEVAEVPADHRAGFGRDAQHAIEWWCHADVIPLVREAYRLWGEHPEEWPPESTLRGLLGKAPVLLMEIVA